MGTSRFADLDADLGCRWIQAEGCMVPDKDGAAPMYWGGVDAGKICRRSEKALEPVFRRHKFSGAKEGPEYRECRVITMRKMICKKEYHESNEP